MTRLGSFSDATEGAAVVELQRPEPSILGLTLLCRRRVLSLRGSDEFGMRLHELENARTLEAQCPSGSPPNRH